MGNSTFRDAPLWTTPVCDLDLTLAGSDLEPVIDEFREELRRAGIHKLRPLFYLSDEWGVGLGTIAIGIPFYLAHPDLKQLQEEVACSVEGGDRADLLRYLRHEMGHVVNYAYRLHEREDWIQQFGLMSTPYKDDFRPRPFDASYVHHLPGWYAQKHPDEDWAETFAVWLTPGLDWRARYGDAPRALEKLTCCDRLMAEIGGSDPQATDRTPDQDVSELIRPLCDYFEASPLEEPVPLSLDDDLGIVFAHSGTASCRPASELIHRFARNLIASVHRWSGPRPERTLGLVRFLEARASALALSYESEKESAVLIGLTALFTSLASTMVPVGGDTDQVHQFRR